MTVYLCPSWDAGGAVQSTASPKHGLRGQSPLCYLLHICTTGVKVHRKLIWRAAPAQTSGSTSEFRTETLLVCPFIPWHGWLFVRQMYATCKSFPNPSAPPPSMHSAHTLTPQQMFQEEVFLTVCILLTTILLQGINIFSCPSTLLVWKQSKTNKKSTTFQTTEHPKPSVRKGKGREAVERKGQRGWITLKLFLSCSSGWAVTTKYRIYQSRWTRKMTRATCFKEQAINEVHSYLLAKKLSKNTIQLAWARFDWTNIQPTTAFPLDMRQCKC